MRHPSARILNSRATLWRYAPTQDADGGQVPGWTEIARDVPCALAPADAQRSVGGGSPPLQGKIMTEIKWTLLMAGNHALVSQDKAVVVDDLGATHSIFVHGQTTPGNRGAIYAVEAVERT